MVTKEKINAMADRLIAEEVAAQTGKRNRLATFLQPPYRFTELTSVQPWRRIQIVSAAEKLADKQLPVIVLGFVWLASFLIVAFFEPLGLQGFRGFLVAGILFGIPFLLVRRNLVHKHVTALCGKENDSK